MGKDEIVENIVASIDGIVDLVPKKWNNVRSLHLKLLESVSLPIYQSIPDYKLKIEGAKANEESLEGEEGKEVSGDEKGRKKKGRIHEVKYMDNDVSESVDGQADDDDDDDDNDDDVRNGDTEDIEVGATVVHKKKAKIQDADTAAMSGLKRMKKSSKDKHEDGDQKRDKLPTKENKGSVAKSKRLVASEDGDDIDKKKTTRKRVNEKTKLKVKKK